VGNTFGQLFRITTWGESHGGGVGVVVDGCPPRLELTEADIQPDLDRRRPGQSKIVSPRKEADRVQILSGTFEGKTLGTPISMWVKNEDARSEAYTEMATKFRPSHADYTYQAKFGIRSWPGGGRTSARETIGRVAAGAIAKKLLRQQYGVGVLAYVKQVQRVVGEIDPDKVKFKDVEANIVRCPDAAAAERMIRLIEKVRREGDTVGGIVEGVARGVPAGWGEPVFDRLEADLAVDHHQRHQPEMAAHLDREHRKLATVTAVRPPSRFISISPSSTGEAVVRQRSPACSIVCLCRAVQKYERRVGGKMTAWARCHRCYRFC
jgi:chorismate synthase